MGKKTNRQKLNFPEVQGWVPYKAFSAKKKNDEINESQYVEVPKDWKEPKFNPEDNPHGRLFASSSYLTLFPKYREKYLSEIWPALKRIMMEHHIRVEINLAESTMEVRTTPRTFDPFIILKARDVIRLLARSVPLEQAVRVLDDETFADIIEINMTNRERFVKRRNRLIGHDGETLKALELSTNCYIVVQGKTVSVVGRYNDLKEVRKIVQGCIYENVHPAYSIKRLLIIKKLSMDPTKQNMSWDRFLPKMKKKILSRRRKPLKVRKKKEYNPFPPAPVPSKIDIELEKGTYFLAEAERKRLKVESTIAKSNQVSKERQKAKRTAALVPPEKRSKIKKMHFEE
ncbi:KRR1 small subunit processome component isoform 1 [Schistosoma japonicum]|uniref:KRR1 small subunit processome component n=1 Tax=Schistosoma japonicum TaxID=6182 RepID=Q86E68_SCHJA|nr:similar to GenBank Accession Number BC016778 HIV-1 rev binding protein 2 in Homo sapiens [Schistosoma japonicum]TNN06137.1 KRR1 small subunit processome component isoform 1 [Schistosoma japonicum]